MVISSRVDRGLLSWLHLEDDPVLSKTQLFFHCILQKTPYGVGLLSGLFPDEALTEFALTVHQLQIVFKLPWEMRVADIHHWLQVIFLAQTCLWGPFNTVFQLSALELFL